MKKEYSAGVVPFRTSNGQVEYLLLHYTAGHWDFPKGHIEEGETKEQAASRELQEETGLQATLMPAFLYSFSYYYRSYQTGKLLHKTVYFFVGQTRNENVHLSDEHQGYAWLSFQDAHEQLTFGNAQTLLQEAQKFIELQEKLS